MLQKLATHKAVLVGAAGALGTLARYGLSALALRFFPEGFEWSTLIVNVTGCFFAGAVWVAAAHRLKAGPDIQAVILIGFVGAFTTFSAFVVETSQLLLGSQWLSAARHVFLQNAAGTGAFFLGMTAARLL